LAALLTQHVDACLILTLNRPQLRNALNDDIVTALEQQVDNLDTRHVRAVVITGAEGGFCAGTDLKEMMALGTEGYFQRIDRMHRLFMKIRSLPVASIAAIHGPALGGGIELAAACTFRVATRNAKLGLPEIKLGVMPCYGGTQFVTRLIGESRALDLMLTGRTLDGNEALALGLINRICESDSALEAALAMAAEFTPYSLVAQQAIRAATAAALEGSLESGIASEREQAHIAFSSEDAKEGVNAFLEKRQAVFKDQ
jgi:enoyl-CoA hydratase